MSLILATCLCSTSTYEYVHLWEDHVPGKEDKHLHGTPRNESKKGAATLNMEAAGTLPPAMAATMGPKTCHRDMRQKNIFSKYQ